MSVLAFFCVWLIFYRKKKKTKFFYFKQYFNQTNSANPRQKSYTRQCIWNLVYILKIKWYMYSIYTHIIKKQVDTNVIKQILIIYKLEYFFKLIVKIKINITIKKYNCFTFRSKHFLMRDEINFLNNGHKK